MQLCSGNLNMSKNGYKMSQTQIGGNAPVVLVISSLLTNHTWTNIWSEMHTLQNEKRDTYHCCREKSNYKNQNNLQSTAIPTKRHFLKRQYWHWFRVVLSITQFWFHLQWYCKFFWIVRRKNPCKIKWYVHILKMQKMCL